MPHHFKCICKNEYLQSGREDTLVIFILNEIYLVENTASGNYLLTGNIRSGDNILREIVSLDDVGFKRYMMHIDEYRENKLEALLN
jgi:hypothetical protein